MSKTPFLLVLLGIGFAAFVLWMPIKQSMVQNKIKAEIESIQPTQGVELYSKSKFGDLIDGNQNDWGWQFVYKYSVPSSVAMSSFKQNLDQAGYQSTVNGGTIEAYKTDKNIHITVKDSPESSAGPAIFVRAQGIQK